jgi:hypothetical protein
MAVFGCGFVQQYGMTETTGTIVALPPEDHTPADVLRMRAAGKAMPGSEVAVVGPDGQRLAAGEVGEVVIRSPQNMAGYWKQEEETARTIDADGWLRSGDAGYMDADGYLYIHDRVKDMIISGGENIYPAEVESAIYGHPAVADVAVIGVPDERWGEAVKAMVVLRPVWPLTPTAFWAGRVSASRVSRCPRASTSSMPCRAIRPASCCAGRCGSRTGRPHPAGELGIPGPGRAHPAADDAGRSRSGSPPGQTCPTAARCAAPAAVPPFDLPQHHLWYRYR